MSFSLSTGTKTSSIKPITTPIETKVTPTPINSKSSIEVQVFDMAADDSDDEVEDFGCMVFSMADDDDESIYGCTYDEDW